MAESGMTVDIDPGDERVRYCSFDSEPLGRRAECIVVTPRGWRSDDRTALPVLYLLHGSDDTQRCWLDKTELLRLSAGQDALLVLPEAGVVGFCTDWQYAQADGTRPQWERFHTDEVPRRVLAGFPTAPRAVLAGVSMGGYGALAYAAKHPGRFAAAASISGLPHLTLRGVPSFVSGVLRRQHEHRHAAFGSPHFARSHWMDSDPYHLTERLRGTGVYLAAGDGKRAGGDEVYPGSGLLERFAARSTWSFARRLEALDIPYTASARRGTHDWPYWRREVRAAWPFLAEWLDRCA